MFYYSMVCVCMCCKFHCDRKYNFWVMKCCIHMSCLYNMTEKLKLIQVFDFGFLLPLCEDLITTVRFELMECFISCWIAAAPLVFQGFVLHQNFFTQRSHVNSSLSRMLTMKCQFSLIIIIDSINEFHVHVSYSQSVSELHTLFTRPAPGFLVG